MRVRIEATAEELRTKRLELVKALIDAGVLSADWVDDLVKAASGSFAGGKINSSAQINTHMGHRMVYTGGATNIAFNVPPGPRTAAPPHPGLKAAAEERARRTVHNRRKLYRHEIDQLRTPQELPLVPVELPASRIDADEQARAVAPKNKAKYTRYASARYENTLSAPTRMAQSPTTTRYYVTTTK